MLGYIRKSSQTWVFKGFFAVLTLAFSSWGISDMLKVRLYNPPAVSVASQHFSATEVVEKFRHDVEQLSAQYHTKIPIEEARQAGVLQQSIDRTIEKVVMEQSAEELYIGIDDDSLRVIIEGIPAFRNQLNQFDKLQFKNVLQKNGMNERMFVAMERSDISKQQLTGIVASGIKTPDILVTTIARLRNEQRVIETVTYAPDQQPLPPMADDEVLQNYYEQHRGDFMAPEYRAVTAVSIRIEDIASTITPKEADIVKSYEIRADEFTKPEKRTIRQVLLDSEEKAKDFINKASEKKDFAAAAKAENMQITELGSLTKAELPFDELAKAAFSLPKNGISGPIRTPLGFSIMEVTAITPGSARSLEEVRPQIIQGLAHDEALNRLYALSTKMEDVIGSGASMEETANSLGITSMQIGPFDDKGRGTDGKPIAALGKKQDIIGTAFATIEGATSEVISYHDNAGYFALHVEKITPTTAKPFATIKPEVVASYNHTQQVISATKNAENAVERLRNGETIAKVAAGRQIETSRPFIKMTQDKSLPNQVINQSFNLAHIGDIALVRLPQNQIVVRLKEIIPAEVNEGMKSRLALQLSKAISSDLMQEYVTSLRKYYAVNVDYAQIDRQFHPKQ